jgi:acyl-CoA dehydrogenase
MEGKLDATKAAVAKLASTDMQGRVADACLQMFGGYGYMLEYPAARAYVDARIQRIYGGTNEIMKEVIARSLVGR